MFKLLLQPTTLIFIGGFIVVMGSFWEAQKSSREKLDFQKQLNKKNEELQTKTDTISELSKKIVEQSNFITESFVGGDSFCYLEFGIFADGSVLPIIHQKGKYPMYDVRFNLMDLDMWVAGIKPSNDELLDKSVKKFNVGNLGPGLVLDLDVFRVKERELIRLKADFVARNGKFIEMIHGRKNERGTLQFAIKVIVFGTNITLFERIPDWFPKDEKGCYDWNAKTEHEENEVNDG